MNKNNPPLKLENISIKYPQDTHLTLDNISFETTHNNITLIIGPSGSGKSTLALTLNRIIPNSISSQLTGNIYINGKNIADKKTSELASNVGIVFQDPQAQIITKTVLEEVNFPAENLYLSRQEILDRSENALKKTGLWEKRYHETMHLSGGEQQLLALAAALALEPKILILDEPTANLDTKNRKLVYKNIQELIKNNNSLKHVLLIDHNLDEIINLVDNIIVLNKTGQIAFTGNTETIFHEHLEALNDLGVTIPTSLKIKQKTFPLLKNLQPKIPNISDINKALLASNLPNLKNHINLQNKSTKPKTILSITNANIFYDNKKIIDNANLHINKQNFWAIIGNNGSGKSTLLKAMCGILLPQKGKISLLGSDTKKVSLKKLAKQVGYIFQNPEHQFLENSVIAEMSYGLGKKISKEETQFIDYLLELFDLNKYRNTNPFILSGGQKRRLSIASALVSKPEVIFLDEPTYGQDYRHTQEIMNYLRQLNELGNTIVMVTHDMDLAITYTSHTAIMNQGRILLAGKSLDVLADRVLLGKAGLCVPSMVLAFDNLCEANPTWSMGNIFGMFR